MLSPSLILLSLAALGSAAPTGWGSASALYYSHVGQYLSKHTRADLPAEPVCDLSRAVLPHTKEPLPDIPEGQSLLAVSIGRGTQNYTCESSSKNVRPKAIGATATLFNASCIAANYPYLLALLPNIALELTNPPPFTETEGPADMTLLGHHYFDSTGLPIFDLHQLGIAGVNKTGAVDAPAQALKGIPDQLEGAVAWLLLESVPSSTGEAKSVYRVNTAGGKAPATCENQPGNIEIQYATEYWFYG
ncbi:hypothetical protein FQN57_001763 [Myotisia sp. PD_48]|nr:hypothetical protein FQN57_001763 [Myotisia sp. PD_48]